MFRLLTVAGTTLLLTGAVASADSVTVGNDAGQIASSKVTMEAAVAAAEKHVNGKAVRAEYERQKDGKWVFDVEVSADKKVFDVKIDPDKGSVLASTDDPADDDDASDKAD